MTKDGYIGVEKTYMLMLSGQISYTGTRSEWDAALATAWHSLTDADRAELDARPPVEGRPRFVSSTATLRPSEAGWKVMADIVNKPAG